MWRTKQAQIRPAWQSRRNDERCRWHRNGNQCIEKTGLRRAARVDCVATGSPHRKSDRRRVCLCADALRITPTEIYGAVGCSTWRAAPYSTRKRACLSSFRQSLAHNVSKILAAGFGRFNNFSKIVPAHCKQFHISLGANRSVATCFSEEPNLPKSNCPDEGPLNIFSLPSRLRRITSTSPALTM